MYNTLMKQNENGRSSFWVYLHRHVGIVYGGNWFEEHIRVFISTKHYENLISGHFPIRRHFFQNNITSLIQFRMFFSNSENEVWMELKDYGCCWKNLKDYYSRKCTLNQSNKKVLHFFGNKWHEKCSNFKVYIWFFTERDG